MLYDEDAGQPIVAQKIDDHNFSVVMPFKRLQAMVENPAMATQPKLRGVCTKLDGYRELHEEIQRAFDKGKRSNSERYAEYIASLEENKGDTPTIDLYVQDKLEELPEQGELPPSFRRYLWRYGTRAVPYDGETQLAARFRAAEINPATQNHKIIVKVKHGLPVEYARQAFHDRNVYQRKASASDALRRDGNDIYVEVIRHLEQRIPQMGGRIEWQGRQLRPGLIATAKSLRTAISCMVNGIKGVQTLAATPPAGIGKQEFFARAELWFGKVIELLQPCLLDRERYVASSPAVWAALGAMGHPLLDASVSEAKLEAKVNEMLLVTLQAVMWEKADRWVGIAIKKTSNGYSFAGGAKDTGAACLKALSDNEAATYHQVRRS